MFAATSRYQSAYSSGGIGLNPLEESYSRCVAYGGDVMHTFARAPADQSLDDGEVAAIATDQAVTSDQPHVSGPGYRLGRRLRDIVLHIRRRRFVICEQRFQFGVAEAHQREVHALVLQFGEFVGQHLLVPPGVHGQPVVRDDICPPLSLAEVVQHHHRNLRETQLAGSQEASVAGNDPVHRIDQDRIGESKLHDGRRDLRDLLRRVGPRVPGVRHQPGGRPDFDAPRHGGRYGRRKR